MFLAENASPTKIRWLLKAVLLWVESTVKSFSQLFFSEKFHVGCVIIFLLGLLSLKALGCALLGVIVSNLYSYLFFKQNRVVSALGGVGYNGCIIGLYLTAFVIREPTIGLFTIIWSSALVVVINYYGRVWLSRFGIPMLSTAPVLVLWAVCMGYEYGFHIDARNYFNLMFDAHYLLFFYVGYLSIYALIDWVLFLFVLLATLPVMLCSLYFQVNLTYLVINLAIAVYAPAGYFIPGHRKGYLASVLVAGVCLPLYAIGVWISWETKELPLIAMPAIMAIWIVFYALFGMSYHLPASQAMRKAAALLKQVAREGKKVICLTGAGISTPSGIPDYASGKWIEPSVSPHTYAFSSFLSSREARKIYFDSCLKFWRCTREAKPNVIHRVLCQWQRKGIVKEIVTQNVDGLLQRAGCQSVIELHGNISYLNCLRCGTQQPWPETALWQESDLFCKECQGFLKPAVKAYEEPLTVAVWEQAVHAVRDANVLLVLGSRLLVSSASYLLQYARENHAQVIFINEEMMESLAKKDDLLLVGRLEQILPILKLYTC